MLVLMGGDNNGIGPGIDPGIGAGIGTGIGTGIGIGVHRMVALCWVKYRPCPWRKGVTDESVDGDSNYCIG